MDLESKIGARMLLIRYIQDKLIAAGYQAAHVSQIAVWLAQKLTGRSHAQLLSFSQDLTADQQVLLNQWVKELVVEHKPLQYILGTVSFGDLVIEVKPPVLIPRPETEVWVLELIDQLKVINKPLTILDMCAGSGCIALALAHALPSSVVIGADIAHEAITLAQSNKKQLGINNVQFVQSDLFEQVKNQTFDLIVTNPPYVSQKAFNGLDMTVRAWEDKRALVAGNSGLAVIQAIVQEAPRVLKKNNYGGSRLVIEIGFDQGEAVCTMLRGCGYTEVKLASDLAGHDRVVSAHRA